MKWKDDAKNGTSTARCGPFELTVMESRSGADLIINCEGARVHGQFLSETGRDCVIERARITGEYLVVEWTAAMVRDLAGRR